MIFSLIYDFSLCILSTLYSLKFTYFYFAKKKYNKSFKQRLGRDFPHVDKKGKPLIWIHAVSVGETRAVIALAKMLKHDYTLLISSITETGHAEAKRALSFADYHVFLPFDLSFIIKPIVKAIKPDFVIISETDLWFQFLAAAKENGAKTILVNGKISEKSEKRMKLCAFFSKRIYGLIDFFAVQSKQYLERFQHLGVPLEKIAVTGNLKFDDDVRPLNHEDLDKWKKRLGIIAGQKVVTIGSTHHPEEIIILDELDKISEDYQDLKILLVPRHPERFDAIEKELILKQADFCRFSNSLECSAKIVLVDAMGLLRNCYQVSTLAIVAGSFIERIGGHNILEPCMYGVPVIFGPYMHSQPDLLDLVIKYHAGIQTDAEHLHETVAAFLDDFERCLSFGENGLQLIADVKGSTLKTFHICQRLFSSKSICK